MFTQTDSLPYTMRQQPASTRPSGGYLPPGAVPTQNGVLSAQAAEFWFPESRDCTCCGGYKHGCNCKTSLGRDTCQICCPGTGGVVSQGAGGRVYQGAPVQQPQTYGSTRPVCRFFLSGTCRNGSSCSFLHPGANDGSSPAGGPGGYVSPREFAPPQMCIFFAKGACQNGDRCKFGHFM